MSKRSTVFDLSAYERQVDKEISRSFTEAYMSNAKWKRLFKVIDRSDIYLAQMLLKRVGMPTPYRTWVPKSANLGDVWIEEGTNDCAYFYKEIEWLELLDVHRPGGWESIPAKHRAQDSLRAMAILSEVGKFEMERTSTGVRIYGYRP